MTCRNKIASNLYTCGKCWVFAQRVTFTAALAIYICT